MVAFLLPEADAIRPLESIAKTQPQLAKTRKCLDIFDALAVKDFLLTGAQ
jgi:hypothetical protein